jgi:hypothetical protein
MDIVLQQQLGLQSRTIPGIVIFMVFFSLTLSAQSVFKTPYGQKYHLGSCRMVENVSRQLLDEADIRDSRLEPCKICRPPQPDKLMVMQPSPSKAVGVGESVQCKGKTQKGTRCKHKTKIANGYCYQHTSQGNP